MLKMKFEESECKFCEANFPKDTLNEEGLCETCIKSGYKIGQSKTADKDIIQSDQKKKEELKRLIREVLVEIQEEKKRKIEPLAVKKCKKCEQEFTPRAPAQAICDTCHGLNDA